MDQDAKIQSYALLAKGLKGRAVVEVITRATSDPAVFGFGELLDIPSVCELQQGEHAPHYALLQLFAYGTWPEYQANVASLPAMNEQQAMKLKQLTVVSLASNRQVVPYSELQQQLQVGSVRELEDFVITNCFYSKVVQGKLDQRNGALQVHDAIGRDVRAESLPELSQRLAQWIQGSEELQRAIEARVSYGAAAAEAAKQRRDEVEAKAEEVKKAIKSEARASDALMDDGGLLDMMDEDRLERMDREMGGRPERGERAPAGRPKSRRR